MPEDMRPMSGRDGSLERVYRFSIETQQMLEVKLIPDDGDVVRIATLEKRKRT
jgi:hypothetical protein